MKHSKEFRRGLILFSIISFFSMLAYAEPWLSNRYAQNCASCHAPGRLNKVASGRRCTLTCQGCHVNPQGGGMRNQYGVWNQQRWLRSMRTEMFKDKPAPAPLERQPYYQRMKELAAKATQYYGGRKPQSEDLLAANRRVRQSPTAARTRGKDPRRVEPQRKEVARPSAPAPMTEPAAPQSGPYKAVYVKDAWPPERLFDRYSYTEWKAVVESERDFLSAIPEGDPYRLERELGVYASGDFRYFAIQDAGGSTAPTSTTFKDPAFFLMASDIGVRLRPIKYHQVSGVFEARFLNGPDGSDPEDGFRAAQAKSAYVLVDDLAYNSFVQAGLYRPMFGHYEPDHNTLNSLVSGLTHRNSLYKGFAFGAAPNVPFLVANYVQPFERQGRDRSADGYIVTAGGRFVTLGASAQASYWSTKYNLSSTLEKERKMISLTGGLMWKDFILNYESLRVDLSGSDGSKDAGNVNSFWAKYRFWRENYLMANLAYSNVAPAAGTALVNREIIKGEATETSFGFKFFLISNLELETLYIMRETKLKEPAAATNKMNLFQLQAHAFF